MLDTKPLAGRTVAITEHRFEKEFSGLIARHGASIVSCPLLEERPVENHSELREFIRGILAADLELMIFFTGVGVRFLAEEAQAMGESSSFREALRGLTLVARGPKPQAELRKLGLTPDLIPRIPTSEGLLELLEARGVRDSRVGVQLYGTPNPEFCSGLEALGAAVVPVQVYNYGPASDRERVNEFIETLLSGRIDALTFTSAPQVESLFTVAHAVGRESELASALNGAVAVAAIGSVTNRALEKRGVVARIFPDAPKMAPLASAIAEYFRSVTR